MSRLIHGICTFRNKVDKVEEEYIVKVQEKLKHYEDLEEAGMIYEIFYFKPFEQWDMCKRLPLIEDIKELGKTVFLTKAEAEQKLAEFRGGQND